MRLCGRDFVFSEIMPIFAPMNQIRKKDVWLFVAQMLLLSLIILSPALISYISSGSSKLAGDSLWISFYWLAPTLGVYLLNFYLLIPHLWFRHCYWLFGGANAVLIIAGNLHLFSNNFSTLPDYARAGFSSFMMISVLLCLMAVDKILKVDRNDCVYIGKEIIHVPDGYQPAFQAFLESHSFSQNR